MALEARIVREGVVAGLFGAGAVAMLILIFDVASGAPLQTPAILGSVIFKGIRDPNLVTVTVGPVVGYTIVHTLAFVGVGLVAAILVGAAEREPPMVLALLIFFAAFEVFFLALVAFWALPVLGVLAWWEILAGNLVASLAMLFYFHRRHPGLARSLIGRWVDVVREGIVAGLFGGAVVAVYLECAWEAPALGAAPGRLRWLRRRDPRRALAVEAVQPGRLPLRRSWPATAPWSASCSRSARTSG